MCVGQKCSALSRLYVSSSLWSSGFKDTLLSEAAKITVGPPDDFSNFMGPVMFVPCLYIRMYASILIEIYCRGRPAYDKITGYIQKAKDAGGEILIGGVGKAASDLPRLF